MFSTDQVEKLSEFYPLIQKWVKSSRFSNVEKSDAIFVPFFLTLRRPNLLGVQRPVSQIWRNRWRRGQIALKFWPMFSAVLRVVISVRNRRIFFENCLKLIFSDVLFIENRHVYGAWLRNRMSHATFQFHSRLRILLSIRENNQINDLKLMKFSFNEL